MTIKFALDARPATGHFPGIGRYVSNLAASVAGLLEPDERLFLLLDPREAGGWPLPLDHDQVEVVDAPYSLFQLRQHWAIPRLLNRIEADLYHAPYYMFPWLIRQPTVLTVYDFIPLVFPETTSVRARRWFAAAHRAAWRRSDHVIAISEATQRDALRFYNAAQTPMTVIPLAPDPRFTPAAPAAIAKVRRTHNLPDRYALYVGINKPHKNLVRLIEAWGQVESEATLVIAGAWDDRYPEPWQRAAELGFEHRILFMGRVADEDLPPLYSGADLFVFPSLYEGFGLPVIEAMACGTAVVCSYTSCLPEVGGVAAVYFNPLETADIAQAIQGILDDPDQRLAHQKKAIAQAQQFTWRAVGKKTVKVYRDLVLND